MPLKVEKIMIFPNACLVCKCEYIARCPNSMFCSRACRKQHRNKLNRDFRAQHLIKNKVCFVCQKEFTVIARVGRKKYMCSDACRTLQHKRNNLVWGLKRYFGSDHEQLCRMLVAQDFKCAICRKHENECPDGLYKDHDHTTGKLRQFLCQQCNSGIGLLNDKLNLVIEARQYLIKYVGDDARELGDKKALMHEHRLLFAPAWIKQLGKDRTKEQECLICNKPFFTLNKSGNIASFCSPACRKIYRKRSYMSWYYITTFGISLEQHDQMLVSQSGRCAICKDVSSRHVGLSVDHNHTTGSVRGLLCYNCNSALGMFFDSIDLIDRAITYLKKHRVLVLMQEFKEA